MEGTLLFVGGLVGDRVLLGGGKKELCCPRWGVSAGVTQKRRGMVRCAVTGQVGRRTTPAHVETTDTSGAVLKMSNFVLQAGSRDLMEFEELKVMPRDRLGLVGPNGSGKTSLLKAISGEFPVAQGRIALMPGKTIGYLPQQAVSGSEKTVWEEASSQMDRLNKAEQELRESELAVAEDPSDKNLNWLEKACQDFELAGGYKKDEKIGNMLTGLGFVTEDWDRKCSELSGGWGMRVALARLLLSEPDVLLLDEPTNHLDTRTKAYLRSFMNQYPYAIVVVSHDQLVLDDSKRIVDVRGGKLEFYTCNYSRFLELRVERDEQAFRMREKQDVEIEKLDRFITRFGAKATKASAANSKKKALEKLEAKLVEAPASTEAGRASLKIPSAPACASICVELEGADIGWSTGPTLLENVSLSLERGMRLAIVGKNGCGKSTLMRSISGLLPLRSGERIVRDDRVEIGVFTQDLAADLPLDLTALEYLQKVAPGKTNVEIRGALGSLGLSGESALRPIEYLSGGEKARVALSCFVLKSHNVLMFDEPSNHLDIRTVQVLIDALTNFDGAMVLVSHDRRLVERIATHVLVVEEGKTTRMFETVTEEALSMVMDVSADETSTNMLMSAKPPTLNRPKAKEEADLKQKKKDAQKAWKRLPTVEKKINSMEQELEEVQNDMMKYGDQPGRLAELMAKQETLQATVDSLYEEYEELESLASEADN